MRMHAPPVAAVWFALAALMFAIAARPPRPGATMRLEGTRAVATEDDRVLWSVERVTIRSVLLRQAGSRAHEVVLALHGGGTVIVPARFDACNGYEFASELWSALQVLRAGDGYRG